MIDRLVCATHSDPDPTTTQGKDFLEAKTLELKGWDYLKHLSGRAYGVVVHNDVAGIEGAQQWSLQFDHGCPCLAVVRDPGVSAWFGAGELRIRHAAGRVLRFCRSNVERSIEVT